MPISSELHAKRESTDLGMEPPLTISLRPSADSSVITPRSATITIW